MVKNQISVRIEGQKQVQKHLKNLSLKKSKDVNNIIHKEGFKLQAEVQNSIAGRSSEPTSVDTGRFLNSVTTDNSKFMQSKVFSDVEYSGYLEDGTTNIVARRHFQMSKSRKMPEIIKAVQQAVK